MLPLLSLSSPTLSSLIYVVQGLVLGQTTSCKWSHLFLETSLNTFRQKTTPRTFLRACCLLHALVSPTIIIIFFPFPILVLYFHLIFWSRTYTWVNLLSTSHFISLLLLSLPSAHPSSLLLLIDAYQSLMVMKRSSYKGNPLFLETS